MYCAGNSHLLALGVVRLLADEVELLRLLPRAGIGNPIIVSMTPTSAARLLERFVHSSVGTFFSGSLKTRCAFSRRNFGHTWSRNGTSGISVKMRS